MTCRFANPIVHGDYPKVMRSLVGDRLPKFTEAESKQIKGSLDFLGLNYYTGYYTEDAPASSNAVNHSWTTDRLVTASTSMHPSISQKLQLTLLVFIHL